MHTVARTSENLEKCRCSGCPSYTAGCKVKSYPLHLLRMIDGIDNMEHYEAMFCAFGKSNCIHEDKGCLCEDCEVFLENDLSRDEVLEELNNIFKELETEVIVLDKYTADQILEVINLINDTINLVITTDKEGYIEKIDLGCSIDFIEDVEINGNLSIKEYLNEEQLNTAKAEIVELYQETIPTIDWDKVPEESKDLITVNDSTIVVKVVQPHYSYSYDYETGTEQYKYYNEYLYLTFDIEDVLGVAIDNSSNPSMANWDSHIYVALIANCSGKCVIDGQWYFEDGTESSYDYSLEEEHSIKDQLYNISIFSFINPIYSHCYRL